MEKKFLKTIRNKYSHNLETQLKTNNAQKNISMNNYLTKNTFHKKPNSEIFINTIASSPEKYKRNNIRKESIRSRYKKMLNLDQKKKTVSILNSNFRIKVNTTNLLQIKVNKNETLIKSKLNTKYNNDIKNIKESPIKPYKLTRFRNINNNIKLYNNYNTENNKQKKESIIKEDLINDNELNEQIKIKLKNIIEKINIKIFNIDEYKIIKSIGEGTYGNIYEVQNKISHKTLAMKKILAKSLEKLKIFLGGIEIIYPLQHKNIMNIIGIHIKYFEPNKILLYILMPLAETDWDSSIKFLSMTKSYYKESELISILSQITSAILYLQENNIVHRDIKPENILIFNNIYKLSDFGEAKITNNLIRCHSLRGTDIYMSPILRNKLKSKEKKVEHDVYKSDVYSLGICFLYASELNFNTVKAIRELKFQGLVNKLIKKMMKGRYSGMFIDIILKMVHVDENERIDFLELDRLIKKYYNNNS